MPRPVCVNCQREMNVRRNGIGVLFYADWGPYQIYAADLYRCNNCGHEVTIGYSYKPISHFDQRFEKELVRLKKTRSPHRSPSISTVQISLSHR